LEMHNKRDIEYAEYSPDLYGINNRDLGSFHTNVQNSFDLVHLLPQNVCKVSESGIDNPDTIKHLRAEGYKGFLMGEAFMHSEDPGMALQKLIVQL
ncbi:MAG: indole-3-glycerol-phosphate synthase TrpC, partial [Bacteroidota bacterium]|nr:indole-3-glycerol-phosphate synthase TrpC [Bacteroidota bacterium]